MSDGAHFSSGARFEPLEGFRGLVRIEGFEPLYVDEPESLGGKNTAPSPLDYLVAAVGGCLMSSFTMCLQKKRVEGAIFAIDVAASLERDSENMLRVGKIEAKISVEAPESEWKKIQGCYGIFKKYCVVSASVARGIPLETSLVLGSAEAR
jgi:uncharacterized OsmC-like protein